MIHVIATFVREITQYHVICHVTAVMCFFIFKLPIYYMGHKGRP